MDQSVNPFSGEHCELCRQLLQSTALTRELIDACERCGLPVGPAKAENEQQSQTLISMEREFMSGEFTPAITG